MKDELGHQSNESAQSYAMRALRVLPHSVRTGERAGMKKERELVLQACICVCENMTDICSGENVRG